MLAAERDQELVARQDLGRDAVDLVHQRRQLAEWQLHFRKCEDADGVDVRTDFFVPQLHVRRGLEDLARTVPRARNVRGRPIDRYGKNDDLGFVE